MARLPGSHKAARPLSPSSTKNTEHLSQVVNVGMLACTYMDGRECRDNTISVACNHLRKVPAAVRFISAEPLLGSLDDLDLTDIHWLIAGGESGWHHRPCEDRMGSWAARSVSSRRGNVLFQTMGWYSQRRVVVCWTAERGTNFHDDQNCTAPPPRTGCVRRVTLWHCVLTKSATGRKLSSIFSSNTPRNTRR